MSIPSATNPKSFIIDLPNEADVFLVDSENLEKYRNKDNFNFVGGHYQAGQQQIFIPRKDTWTAIVDSGNFGETFNCHWEY
ncbi:protein of unknown function [Oenococcus oeni]|uniref:DUF1883 domain-containing protein n=1 Tax=Oenococcus oeni TaxID=1247 RepID=UPI0010797582|nr:DUF1883 domain-containing protein [Oenococcus oeni]AVI94075.1 hypothetical protein AX764_04175 [Oenococcus oeni]SYV99733.1 hypothetical protein OENI_20116 [Oenococcus oeni]SYW03922.1 hypothetical protein OENI_90054 [Oenococcus oeni]SYW17687.1 hypothetical protein OENI_10355 [Oenococcus oeni]VDC14588.1 protein of unknown function [Oenococcus oeni]